MLAHGNDLCKRIVLIADQKLSHQTKQDEINWESTVNNLIPICISGSSWHILGSAENEFQQTNNK